MPVSEAYIEHVCVVCSYGGGQWMLDVDMDCSRTENSWFQYQALVLSQTDSKVFRETFAPPNKYGCGGTAPSIGPAPFSSANTHTARCGVINRHNWNMDTCQMDAVP